MQKELQREKAKGNYKRNMPYATFEKRLRKEKMNAEEAEKVMQEFIGLAATRKYTYVCEIACELNYDEEYIYKIIAEFPELKRLYSFGKQFLGTTGLTGVRDYKYKESAILPYLHDLLPSVKNAEDRQDERKIKLANEGAIEGQTKVLVVNENIREEKPE